MIVVRKASRNNALSISKLCIEAWRDTYADILSPEEIKEITETWYSIEEIQKHIEPRERWDGWWVADEAGKIVGASGWEMTSETETELFDLYIDVERRGKGIGSQLLEVATNEARAKGAKEQWATVEPKY